MQTTYRVKLLAPPRVPQQTNTGLLFKGAAWAQLAQIQFKEF